MADAGGALTLNSVPVTTVTWDPGCTWEGSSAMITAPRHGVRHGLGRGQFGGVFDE